jgi:hypothetical protein
MASTDFLSFGVASPVYEALGRGKGAGIRFGNKAHKLVQWIEIGKRWSRVFAGIARRRAAE